MSSRPTTAAAMVNVPALSLFAMWGERTGEIDARKRPERDAEQHYRENAELEPVERKRREGEQRSEETGEDWEESHCTNRARSADDASNHSACCRDAMPEHPPAVQLVRKQREVDTQHEGDEQCQACGSVRVQWTCRVHSGKNHR